MTAELTRYDHQGRIVQTRVHSDAGTVTLSLGGDGPRTWVSVTAQISPDDARHMAGLLEQAAEDADG